jgi:DNA-binding MarR family transcriptional regulator
MVGKVDSLSHDRLQVLADFRHHLRKFLQFSEAAAGKFNLHPQQHQLLLQIAGAPNDVETTIGYASARLGITHHAAVALSQRCEEADLLSRIQGKSDKRTVILAMTAHGHKILEALSEDHEQELKELAPQLIENLLRVSASARKTRSNSKKQSSISA